MFDLYWNADGARSANGLEELPAEDLQDLVWRAENEVYARWAAYRYNPALLREDIGQWDTMSITGVLHRYWRHFELGPADGAWTPLHQAKRRQRERETGAWEFVNIILEELDRRAEEAGSEMCPDWAAAERAAAIRALGGGEHYHNLPK